MGFIGGSHGILVITNIDVDGDHPFIVGSHMSWSPARTPRRCRTPCCWTMRETRASRSRGARRWEVPRRQARTGPEDPIGWLLPW